ncbi:hypothetical protein LWI28_005887 [Acer negundo]|uniref:S-protein homolog n=1 Tax=Acer negundo TaxID=4023 RepID=A0AAD5JSB1_ACENE|nr:hypothetical protein LWI28_005887 [Acer negundo]
MRNPNRVQQPLLIIQIILLSSSKNTENFVEARFYQNDATVKIYNDLGPDTTLMINCNSKNDDLGTHYLKYKQHFDWSFGLSIFGNTKYWCDVYWNNNGAQNFYPFDMMRINHGARGYRDYDLCEPCAWRITKDGGYRYHNKLNFEEWDKVYNW